MMVSVKIKEEIKVESFELLRIRDLRVRKTHVRIDAKISGLNKWLAIMPFKERSRLVLRKKL